MTSNFIQCIFFIFVLNVPKSFSQERIKYFHASLWSRTARATLSLDGDVDFFNSFVYLPWRENYKVYQNLVEVSLTNSDTIPIRNPFVSLNGSRLWKYSSDIDKNYVGNDDFDRSALLIWRTFIERSIHRNYPVPGYRVGAPVDLLTVFGYGMCYNRAAAVGRLPSNESKFSHDLWAWKHTVSEFSHGGESAIIDTDLNSFYLDLSNSGLSSKDVISKDRYLIKRTHHYGRQYEYDKAVNEYIANFYSPDPKFNFVRPLEPSDFSLTYDLVPGENMILDYSAGKYFYRDSLFNIHPDEIANGYFSYDWNVASNNHFLVKENLQNINITGKRIFKNNPELEGSMNFQLNHGFQIVFFEFSLDLGEEYTHTPVMIEISRDSLKWMKPISIIQDGNVIKYRFDLTRNSVMKKLFVRVLLGRDEVEIRNFGYTSYFQINRLALPQLKLGFNSLQVLHDNERESLLTVDIKYKEKASSVPMAIQAPEFPLDAQVVYGPLREISWNYPGKSKEIINYEFSLTKDTLTHFPLSPNFLAYTNAINSLDNEKRNLSSADIGHIENRLSRVKSKKSGRTINKFIVHEEGFFNSGELYFWRVRPLNSNGVWGPWSRYFSFQMKKVMPPVNLNATERELTWETNPSGAGAESFEVYGSNEYLGFDPELTNLISITPERKIQINDVPFAFFRVVSVDSLGNESEISEYASRPYPYLKDVPAIVYPDSLFQYKLSFTPAFFSMVAKSDKYEYDERVDMVTYKILKMPPWLKLNHENSTVEGIASEEVLRSELDSGENVIELKFFSEIFSERRYILKLEYDVKNERPKSQE